MLFTVEGETAYKTTSFDSEVYITITFVLSDSYLKHNEDLILSDF